MKRSKPLTAAIVLVLSMLGMGLLAALFAAYQHPALLLDFANLMFCG